MVDKKKPRRRNLKTVKQIAKERSAAKKRRPRWRIAGAWLASPWVALFKWINQPAYIHSADNESVLTKNRSMFPAYVRSSFAELRLVTWPKFPVAWRLTWAVFLFAAFFAIVVSGLDWAMTSAFQELILNRGENLRELF